MLGNGGAGELLPSVHFCFLTVVSLNQEADFNTDGTIDVRVSLVNTYNSRGQLVNSMEQDDFDGNGTIDFIRVTTVLYNGAKP